MICVIKKRLLPKSSFKSSHHPCTAEPTTWGLSKLLWGSSFYSAGKPLHLTSRVSKHTGSKMDCMNLYTLCGIRFFLGLWFRGKKTIKYSTTERRETLDSGSHADDGFLIAACRTIVAWHWHILMTLVPQQNNVCWAWRAHLASKYARSKSDWPTWDIPTKIQSVLAVEELVCCWRQCQGGFYVPENVHMYTTSHWNIVS